jgi:hypothetical protein
MRGIMGLRVYLVIASSSLAHACCGVSLRTSLDHGITGLCLSDISKFSNVFPATDAVFMLTIGQTREQCPFNITVWMLCGSKFCAANRESHKRRDDFISETP